MKQFLTILGLTVAIACGNAAIAHPEHDEMPVKPAPVKLEAKKTPQGAIVSVTSAGAAVPTAGASGTLTLGTGAKAQVVPLQPNGTNAMEARTKAKIAAGTKAQANIVFADKSTTSAEVTIN